MDSVFFNGGTSLWTIFMSHDCDRFYLKAAFF